MKQYTQTNRVLAGVSFLIALMTYALTLQPSVPFWDCGEFSAATAWQQVPHPPGAPLWLFVARMFHMTGIGDPGWRINMAAAVCSAFTAMLVYLIVARVIERWRPYRENRSLMSYLPTFGGGLIAALAFTWSDSQWFNSVESEVYAGGILLIAVLVYLMMLWDQRAERPGHERYLLMISYVLGLAIGVHLLALLVVPAIAMVIYFRHYKPSIGSFLALMAITGIAFLFLIYKATIQYIPQLLASNAVIGLVLLIGLIGVVWWSIKERKPIIYMGVTSFLLIILGFTTYTQILVRANAHPPMNENEPDTFSELVSYLGREQYGNAPNWPRRYQVEQYYRQYQDKYDEGTDGHWTPPVRYNEDNQPVFDQVNTSGEMKFMWQYQTYHMYIRYFLWNFVGRVSDVQDAGVAAFSVSKQDKQQFITPTGYPDVFPVKFWALPLLLGLIGVYFHYKKDWKMAFVFTTLFLFLGLFPTWQQNQQQPQPRERDYFYTGSFMIFAVWIGLGAAGIAEKVAERTRKSESEREGEAEESSNAGAVGGVLALCLLAVPLNMGINGWKLHDRSKNWVPWDYSYNILQSLEKDAILFTNGDNDTFPLWYLQDVAGIRRDVRVVNLSLGNTLWYIYQLKNEQPWGAKKVPISFPDNMLKASENSPEALHYDFAPPAQVSVEVPAETMKWATNGANAQAGQMSWTLKGEARGGDSKEQLVRVQDKLVRDIVVSNKWQRPVYFSSTVGPDAWTGLEDYFRKEGMAYRIMPVRQEQSRTIEPMNYEVMKACLMTPVGESDFSQTPKYGFKFRNLTDRAAFFMEDHRRLMLNYRTLYTSLARYELSKNNNPKGTIAVLDRLEQVISPDMFAMPYPQLSEIAQLYRDAGDSQKASRYADRAIAAVDALGDDWANDPYARQFPPPDVKAQMLVVKGEYDRAIQSYQALESQYPNDPNLRSRIEELRTEKYLSKKDTAGAVSELQKIISSYDKENNPSMKANVEALRARLAELTHTQVAPPDNTTVGDSTAPSPAPRVH
jgi:tetratricopeptide (TPR) repeat protein